MKHRKGLGAIAIIGGLGAVIIAIYLLLLRPWHIRWGATEDEVSRVLPGDELVKDPDYTSTRAITIAATPEQVWPWLVQMGFRRAGFYSIDWIDNSGKPSATTILPELQDLKVGDTVLFADQIKLQAAVVEPNSALVWAADDGTFSMTWYVYPLDAGHSRLIVRERGKLMIPWSLITDPGGFVMSRQTLLGIRARAEAMPD